MDKRIYVQLQPDERGIDDLVAIQRELDSSRTGRLMPPEELHMTVIHFGKSRDVLAAVRRESEIDEATYDDRLAEYVGRTQNILTDDTYDLTPAGFGHFGARGKTLVIRYEAPPELAELHSRAYSELTRFLGACGIADPETFVRHDPNFKNSRELKPHVTLYKGYEGRVPDIELGHIAVRFMKLVY